MTRDLKCHLCQRRAPAETMVVTTKNELVWCADLVSCKHRARMRLNIRQSVSRQMGLEERQRERDRQDEAWDEDELPGASIVCGLHGETTIHSESHGFVYLACGCQQVQERVA